MATTLGRIELMPRASRPRPDFLLIGGMAVLSALGLLMIFSVTAPRLESLGIDRSSDMVRQAIFMVGGMVVFVVASLPGDRQWKMLAPYVYALSFLLLVAVLLPIGISRQGAQRWIPLGIIDLQPSEFAKPAVILALAALLSIVDEERVRWMRIAQSIGLVAVPSALIFLQPDLGTMLVFGFVVMVMLFVSGTTLRQLLALAIVGLVALVMAFQLNILKEYQVARLTGFLNSGEAELTLNYNQNQSQIAIGAGGLTGRGYGEGTQTNLAFVPAQRTDFIFTAVGEQLGFVGSVAVLGVYALIIYRLFMVVIAARDKFGQLVATGAAAMFSFHVFVNVGMTVGLLPVTGLPLPLMSYGGSFYGSMALTLGIVHAIWLRRTRVPGERHLL